MQGVGNVAGSRWIALTAREAALAAALALVCALCCVAGWPQLASADEGSAYKVGSIDAQADGSTTSVVLPVAYGQTEARSMLDMINEFRTGPDAWAWDESDTQKVYRTGLKPLVYDYELERVAMTRAAEIAVKFDHQRLDGMSYVWDSFGGRYYVGENIAAGQPNAAMAFQSWQETNDDYDGQGHRRNMLSEDFTAVGIGHAVCNGRHFWVQVFCSSVLNTTETTAVDADRDVPLSIANPLIIKREAGVSQKTVTLHPGESVDLPTATVRIGTDRTWPGETVPVKPESTTWASANPEIAQIANGKIVAGKIGSTTLTATVTLGSPMRATVTVNVEPWYIWEANVDAIASTTYDGMEKKPAINVTFNGKKLVADADYTVVYENNTEVGTAKAIITGTGNFAGEKQVTFDIKKASIADAEVSGVVDKVYQSTAVTQTPTVTLGSTVLEPEKDYKLYYRNNTKVGTATMTIKGWGSRYEGAKEVTFKITKIPFSKVTVSELANEVYTGSAITPKPVVKNGSVKLIEGSDYTLDYQDNTEVGTAKVIVTGAGFYEGSKTVSFQIVKPTLESAYVSGFSTTTYTGKKITQEPTVTVAGKTLKAGTDYTVVYKNNVKAGTATATIEGNGSYTGFKTATFTILPATNQVTVAETSVTKTFKAHTKTERLSKAKTVTLPKAIAAFGKAKWKVSSQNGKKALSLKSGKVQVKKGAQRGTYTMTLRAEVAKTTNYTAAYSEFVTVKVTVE